MVMNEGTVELEMCVEYSPDATRYDFFDMMKDNANISLKLTRDDQTFGLTFKHVLDGTTRTITKDFTKYFGYKIKIECVWNIPNGRMSLYIEKVN